MILVTGAGGKTGQSLIRQLKNGVESVRALVRRAQQAQQAEALGAAQGMSGDMRDPAVLASAFAGARAVYHICPNMSPDELQIAENAIAAAHAAGVERFVYHSVLHPQVEAMHHHWLKMRVEECLFASGLDYTILQPGAYMQNVAGYADSILRLGVYPVPYRVEARLSIVDLEDVAEAAAQVLREPGHTGAIYELAGPEALSQVAVAQILSQVIGRPVEARTLDRAEWERDARRSGMPAYAVETLLSMFLYYENNGLVGNPNVLAWLLGRPAHHFADVANQIIKGG